MKNKNSVWMGALILAVGVALLIFNRYITSYRVVATAGGLFILSGVVYGLMSLNMRRRKDPTRREPAAPYAIGMVLSFISVVFGVVVLFMNTTFQPLIPILFGLIVCIGALSLFYSLTWGVRPAVLPGWLYIIPTLMAVLAVMTFMLRTDNPDDDRNVMIYTGISLCLYSLCVFIGSGCLAAQHSRARKAECAQAEAEVAKSAATKPAAPKSLDDDDKPKKADKPEAAKADDK